jgi:hypothetical protein
MILLLGIISPCGTCNSLWSAPLWRTAPAIQFPDMTRSPISRRSSAHSALDKRHPNLINRPLLSPLLGCGSKRQYGLGFQISLMRLDHDVSRSRSLGLADGVETAVAPECQLLHRHLVFRNAGENIGPIGHSSYLEWLAAASTGADAAAYPAGPGEDAPPDLNRRSCDPLRPWRRERWRTATCRSRLGRQTCAWRDRGASSASNPRPCRHRRAS